MMFFRLFKYQLLQTIRAKEIMFWSLAFPLILGTLFFVTFGSYTENAEIFHAIPIAYVADKPEDEYFLELLEQLEEQDDPLVKVTKASPKEAQKMLAEKEIKGYFTNADEVTLTVKEEGIYQSILKTMLGEYQRKQAAIERIVSEQPQNLQAALEETTENVDILREEQVSSGNMDVMITYFYALLAMSCLYGCFMGSESAIRFKANLSGIGARRIVASTNRFVILLADVSAKILLQFICSLLAIIYLVFILKLDLGTKMPQIVLLIFAGSTIGVMTGFFISSLGKGGEQVKTSICVGVTMMECFMSGLMVSNMYYVVEEFAPILNRINPAALIVDAFYSLNVYDTYTRYTQNVVSLLIIAGILGIGSFLAVKEERYASI